MANAFYNRGANFNPDELADGDAIEAEFDAVARGFDTIGTNVDTNKAGYPTQTFLVAPATDPAHAIQKQQVDTLLEDKQPLDLLLTALAALTTSADKLPYFTGADTAALTTLTSFARTLLDDASAAAARTTLGVPALSDFGSVLSSSGYQDLPGGFIMQWQIVTHSSIGTMSFSFPIPYPQTPYLVLACDQTGANPALTVGIAPLTASTFSVTATDSLGAAASGGAVMVFSIGK